MLAALTVAGTVLISVALIDVFQTLFHPAGRGAMSDWTARLSWKAFRRMAVRKRGLLTYAGPTSIALIIASWAALTWIGFALIYLPRLRADFSYPDGQLHHGIVEALSLSLGALITLSEGVHAKPEWLQLLRGVEAVIGFGLLTASVSWLLSIYPVLEARRSIAERATLLHHAERQHRIDMVSVDPEHVTHWMFSMGCDLASLRNQMAQFPISFYFHVGERQTSISGALPYLSELAERAARTRIPGLQIAGTVLGGAVYDFLETLADVFLRMPSHDKAEVLQRYASEQMSDLLLRDRTIPFPRRA